MRHLAVPHHLAYHRADGSTLLGHGHIVDVVVEHGQQLTHQVKFHPCQNAFVRKAFQFPDAGAQGGILTVQFLDAFFQVDSGGVCVTRSDCPGQDCVHTGRITRSRQSIVCLPEQVVIQLTGGTSDAYVVLG